MEGYTAPEVRWLGLRGLTATSIQIANDTKERPGIRINCDAKADPDAVCCACAGRPLVMHGYRKLRRRDVSVGTGLPTWLHIKCQRQRCQGCGKTSSAALPEIDHRHWITKRLRIAIERSVLKRSFEDTAHLLSVNQTLVRCVFEDLKDRYVPDPEDYQAAVPRVLGVDEVHIAGEKLIVLVDMEKGCLIDMLQTGSDDTLKAYFRKLEEREPGKVEMICQDMDNHYAKTARETFQDARIVIDRFHAVNIANNAFQKARILYQKGQVYGQRRVTKEEATEIIRNWRLFLADEAKLSDAGLRRLRWLLKQHPYLALVRHQKIKFLSIYEAADEREARKLYQAWRGGLPHNMGPALRPCRSIVNRWHRGIFAFHVERQTSGRVERMNRSIRKVAATRGKMSFLNLRAWALMELGDVLPVPSRAWAPQVEAAPAQEA